MTDAEHAEAIRQLRTAFCEDNATAFRQLLDDKPLLKARINDPIADFDSPLITQVRSAAMLDVLLDAGADINARSRWWAGGFGLLDCADPSLAAYAIGRGAVVTAHAAARLGMVEKLTELIAADPEQVHARGGDGQTPLHFASTVEIADLLLDHGANLDVRDIDHESTPAQYMVSGRPEVARHLIARGCTTDILMATALGDAELVRRHLDADADCIRMRVSDEYFPMIGEGKGGTIYQWALGWYVSACQVAKSFGHAELLDELMARSPADERLLNACWFHDEELVGTLLADDPKLTVRLPAGGRRQLAHAARNNDTVAARLMLAAGLPTDVRSQHNATALHWAAFHGNIELARLLLNHGAVLDDTDNEYHSTPLGWAIYGSENAWDRPNGDHPGVVQALLAAGAAPPETLGGTENVRAVLRQHGVQ